MSCQDGDASTELFRRYGAAMFALACRIARDPALAEEASQDACVQAWRDASRYDASRGSVLSWLLVIVRGRTLDRLRARQTREGYIRCGFDADTTSSTECAADDAFETRDRIGVVDAALDVLPDNDRRAIQLAYYEGLTHTEIADRLDVPLGTAKTQLRRGMQTLRTAMHDGPRRPFQWRATAAVSVASALPLVDVSVLVVDDEADTVKLTTLVLKRAGASVVCAASAQQALERLENAWPDIALIDLEMPDVDGYALMTRMRGLRKAHTRRLPAAAFTARGAARDRERTRSAGFDLHFAKPIRPSLLVDGLMRLSRRRPADVLP
jgi:RNA polymerase sigma-70 factor (ECF subfamily)